MSDPIYIELTTKNVFESPGVARSVPTGIEITDDIIRQIHARMASLGLSTPPTGRPCLPVTDQSTIKMPQVKPPADTPPKADGSTARLRYDLAEARRQIKDLRRGGAALVEGTYEIRTALGLPPGVLGPNTSEIVEEIQRLKADLAACRAELDASCNAEELRQVRADLAAVTAERDRLAQCLKYAKESLQYDDGNDRKLFVKRIDAALAELEKKV